MRYASTWSAARALRSPRRASVKHAVRRARRRFAANRRRILGSPDERRAARRGLPRSRAPPSARRARAARGAHQLPLPSNVGQALGSSGSGNITFCLKSLISHCLMISSSDAGGFGGSRPVERSAASVCVCVAVGSGVIAWLLCG
ncbi:hypothetical protein D8O27_05395 [Burkholderia mallei]|uniref:Uncharacterized protein n=1 Tax=Burkholderia mallei (strain ATCC 23344) TaxID=243160 RepID=A0A0H2WBF8_BURMA|nr:hypothetical protein BMAA1553 [Burkholderia mallei ATCC 23344]AUG24734.1 hypothetical protein CXQ84_30870 [Burkholderia pseudomallei]EDO88653.1 hypothetical protein BURPS406E_D0871 [Burkholderia pseudomallei 406e]EDU12725.1 hypothetical protein BURPS1655_D1664 [Burkholderia pseudomallei 1655]PNX03795.1 hypothetical protein CF649_11505 [Burkholderia sp. 136(2017)]PNX15819.1 hypothetical protein CF650_10300 [Burkholderia sp. 129]PNX30300.1 hypothetical protein CF647_11550 [Burkholderia sp. 1